MSTIAAYVDSSRKNLAIQLDCGQGFDCKKLWWADKGPFQIKAL
jgi:hypothetical protein